MNFYFKERIKWMLYPGINLHARERFRIFPDLFNDAHTGCGKVLDAGCGNGMLSYRSWQRGNSVLGITIKESESLSCRELFNGYLTIPEGRLRFMTSRISDLKLSDKSRDEIICSEVLEHIIDDLETVRLFSRWLKPGGVLHLCAPNAAHPDNQSMQLDLQGKGGHVRAGYTMETYRQMIEPCGFILEKHIGLGNPFRQAFNKKIIKAQCIGGFYAGYLLYLCWLCAKGVVKSSNAFVPLSIYVRARRK